MFGWETRHHSPRLVTHTSWTEEIVFEFSYASFDL